MLFRQLNGGLIVARRVSISIVRVMIPQAKYGVLSFFSDDIMIATRIGVVFLAQVVESIIGWTKYPQTYFHESSGKKERY